MGGGTQTLRKVSIYHNERREGQYKIRQFQCLAQLPTCKAHESLLQGCLVNQWQGRTHCRAYVGNGGNHMVFDRRGYATAKSVICSQVFQLKKWQILRDKRNIEEVHLWPWSAAAAAPSPNLSIDEVMAICRKLWRKELS